MKDRRHKTKTDKLVKVLLLLLVASMLFKQVIIYSLKTLARFIRESAWLSNE